jgi:hypothetical protein
MRTRRVPVLAQDTGVQGPDGTILTASVPIAWEALEQGPTGHRVQVVDYDATTQTLYRPPQTDPDQVPYPFGDKEILGDPGFHAKNAYALVMRTLARFEYALGRRVTWNFPAHQLKVVPHAFQEMNAFYSREAQSVVFGYYRRGNEPVFLCLSHDIVVHETTHALLDGLRGRFMAPSSPDQAAFHEGFADIVALLSVFSLRDVLGLLIERDPDSNEKDGVISRADVTADKLRESVLLGLAEDMAAEAGGARVNALRRSVDLEPDRNLLNRAQYREPHRRGEVLVAATMRAFVDAWVRRLVGPAATQTELIDLRRVIEEGADVADTLLTMAIRGLDYTPPVHLEFGDFLSAMLTADTEVRADDAKYGLRQGLLESYASYGIEPASKTADGVWTPSGLQLTSEGVRFGSLQTDPVEMFRLVWANLAGLSLTDTAYTRIASLRPCIRTSPEDGLPLRETVAECIQYRSLFASELAEVGLVKPTAMANTTRVALEGGSTLILDDYGRLKYEVHNRLPNLDEPADVEKAQRRLDSLWEQGYYAEAESVGVRLATIHRLRAIEPSLHVEEVW